MANAPLRTVICHLRHLVSPAGEDGLSDAELLRRFVATRDEAAFELLVWRHGSLVWGVCRRVLQQEQDAEDAFQATFLVLARRAATIGRGEALAGWLHQVAARLARAARTRRFERVRREALVRPATRDEADPGGWHDLRPLLDEEIGRLPEKYRRPFLLCYLEGKTTEQAARELGCPRGTVGTRLAWARARLRLRLSRRGVTLAAAAPVLFLAATAAPALPPLLARAAVRVAFRKCLPPAPVAALAADALRGFLFARIRVAAALLGAVLLLAAGASVAVRQAPAAPPSPSEPAERPARTTTQRLDAAGDVLPDGALLRLGTTRFRHGHLINAIALSPNGKLIASAGGPAVSVLTLWDAATGKEVRRLDGHAGWLLAAAFSPDGKVLASAGHEWEVYLWDIATGKQMRRLVGHQAGIRALAFSADGKTLATASDDGSARLWEWATGKELRRLDGHAGAVQGVAFALDGKTLATASAEGTVRLWNGDGKELRRLDGLSRGVTGVAFAPDGKALAGAGEDGTVHFWDPATGKVLQRLSGHQGVIWCVSFAPDGVSLASAGDDGTVRLWDVATGKERRKLKGSMRRVHSVVFSGDGRTLFVGGWEGVVRRWDTATGKEEPAGGGHDDWVHSLAFSPDGKTLASAGEDGTLRLWDAATGKERWRLNQRGFLRSVAFSPDGKLLMTGGEDGTDPDRAGPIQLRDAATGQEMRSLTGHAAGVRCVAFAADGKTVAAGCADRIIRAWDVPTGKEVRRFEGTENAEGFSLAFSPDGKILFSSSDDGFLRFWDAATGRALAGSFVNFEGRAGSVKAVAFSPDGRLAAAAGKDGVAQVWELSTGKLVARLEGGFGWMVALAFSADGKTLAAGGWRQGLCVWDLTTGKERARLTGHRGDVVALAFSHDGQRLASAGGDTTVLLWDVAALPNKPAAGELSPVELEALWGDLAGADAARAWRAVWRLALAPAQGVTATRDYLARRAEFDPARIKRLIAELDEDDFAVRDRASEELAKLGAAAESALRETLKATASAEVRQRVTQLLDKLAGGDDPNEARRLLRVIALLEQIGTPEARRLLEKAGRTDPDSPPAQDARAALERLERRSANGR
jgi:RNA polymerase sigma factor (sigma-70 family)